MIIKMVFKYSIFICLLLVHGRDGLPLESEFERELLKVLETGESSAFLKNIAEEFELRKILNDEDFSMDLWSHSKVSQFCLECATVINVGLASNDPDFVINNSKRICRELYLASDAVCEGLIDANAPAVIYMAAHYGDSLGGKDMCGFIFEGDCTSNNPDRIWEVTLPDFDKPSLVAEPVYPSIDSVPTYKILHLSDTHVDPKYLAGANAACDDEYFCCRKESNPSTNPDDAAGYWGEYRSCDLPYRTLEVMYQHIADTQPDIDFIVWTGDAIPHIVWDTDKESTLQILQDMTDMLQFYFPGVPVYPAMGNHDTNVVNQFSQPYIDDEEFNMAWLYVPLVDMWSDWLPTTTNADFVVHGSYNLLVKPGLRLISVNTNYCQSINWWSLIDSNDGGQELYRLAQTLQNAENFGEKVYIIQHISPGSCFHVYSHQYNLIIARYEAIITGIFYGHSHHDHFKLFFDPDDSSRVYDIGYIGQSQTTYTNINPGYKIYTTEGAFMESMFRVLDHENYYFPLDIANSPANITDVQFLYSAKDDYGLKDLSPQSWLDLIYEMDEPDNQVFVDFHRNYVKNGPDAYNCDEGCKHGLLCSLLGTDSSLSGPCRLD